MKVLDSEFHFTLEVCAAEGNQALPSIPYMGLDNGRDALKDDWSSAFGAERVYMNPPYSMLPAFMGRAFDMRFSCQTIVCLIPAYTDTAIWWDYIVPHAAEIRFLKGRLKFWENGAPGKDTARFPSALVIYRKRPGVYRTAAVMHLWDWKYNL